MYDVIIVGGGFAGLSAAAYLAEATPPAFRVCLVEARERLGGRVHTVGGIDMGASWVCNTPGNAVRALAAALLPSNTTETELFTDDGPLLARAPVDEAWAAVEAHVEAARGACSGADTSLAALLDAALRALTLSEPLAAAVRSRAHAHWGTLMASTLGAVSGAHFDEVGPRDACAEEALVEGGFSGVVRALAARSGRTEVMLGAPVARVEWGAPPAGVLLASGARLAARAVICTAPLGLLKAACADAGGGRLAFAPRLPPPVAAAISRLGYGTLNKASLVFERDPELGAGPFDGRARCFEYLPSALGAPPAAFPYLLQQSLPDGAVAVTGLCVPAAVGGGPRGVLACNALLEQLRRMAGGAELPPVVRFQEALWDEDEWSLGSYSFMGIGASPADRSLLCAPLGGVLWLAGEHTATPVGAGYTHGAIDAGAAAAAAVLRHLQAAPAPPASGVI